MASRATSSSRPRALADRGLNQSAVGGKVVPNPAVRSISRGPLTSAGSRSTSGSRFESGRVGQQKFAVAPSGGASSAQAMHVEAEPVPAVATSASSAPLAPSLPEIVPGVPSLSAQIVCLYAGATAVAAEYKNGYAQVLAMDLAAIEKKAKVADNLGKMRAKREALTLVKAALQDCVTRRAGALEYVRSFEATFASKLTEAAQIAGKNGELQSLVAERDQRIAELEAETEAAEEGFQGQHAVVVEIEEAYQQAQERIKELEEAVEALDKKNQAVEDEKLLAESHLEELQGEFATFRARDKEREVGASRMTHEREALSVEITTLQGRTRTLERDLERATHERERAREQLSEVRADLAETRERLRGAQQTAESNLARSSETASDLMNKNAALLAQISSLVTDNSGLSGRLGDATREVRLLRDVEAELTKQLDAARAASAALSEQLGEMRGDLQAATAAAALVPALQESVSFTSGRLMEAEAKLVAAAVSEAAWRSSGAAWEADKGSLSAQLADMTDRHAAKDAELTTLKSSLGATQNDLARKVADQARETEELKAKQSKMWELRAMLKTSEGELRGTRDDLFTSEMERRRLHNMIQELKGNIRVYVRVRPFLPGDADPTAARAMAGIEDADDTDFVADPTPAITVAPDATVLEIVPPPSRGTKEGMLGGRREVAKPLKFTFDHVFGQRCGQEDVFNEVSHLVQSALDGYNVCLFSYGQTGSGKTHTMQGSPTDPGLIPRCVKKILDTVTGMARQGWVYTVEASFLEIYNESVRDLLRDVKKGGAAVGAPDMALTVHQDAAGNTDVPGLTRVPILEAGTVDGLLSTAARRRAVAATSMNAQSSRSHSVFTLYVRGEHAGKAIAVTGALNLVDLAGSERLDRSGAEGDRKKETAAINKSLSCLADVFTALSKKAPHVPFRNSKLTHLLQPCFRGDGKTLMLVNLSPTMASAFESTCSARFAAQVSQVELGKGKKKVETLDEPVSATGGGGGAPPPRPPVAAAHPNRSLPGGGVSSRGGVPASSFSTPHHPSSSSSSSSSSVMDTSMTGSEAGHHVVDTSYALDGVEEREEGDGGGGDGQEGDDDGMEEEMDMHTLGLGAAAPRQAVPQAKPPAPTVLRKAAAAASAAASTRPVAAAPPVASAGTKRPAGGMSAVPGKPTTSSQAPAGAVKKPRFMGK